MNGNKTEKNAKTVEKNSKAIEKNENTSEDDATKESQYYRPVAGAVAGYIVKADRGTAYATTVGYCEL